MASPARLAVLYATDEDIAIRCYSDFTVLTPSSSLLIAGADGVFDAADLWTLTSATVDFAARGLAVGHVVKLTKPQSAFKGKGEWLAVGAVAAGSVTLRRIGMDDGVGQPPSPIGGLTAVEFSVATLAPQIEQCSDELNRRFGIDPAFAMRAPSWIYDVRELREACMTTVLHRQYTVDARQKDGDFAMKIRELCSARDAAIGRLQVRWGPTGNEAPPTSMFGMRIVR